MISRRRFLEQASMAASAAILPRSLPARSLRVPAAFADEPAVDAKLLERAKTLLRQAPFIDTHNDLPTMLIGGFTALLLQSLHPLAMAGVAAHSSYREDPLGRLRRTAGFVAATTFGTVEEAEAAIAQVQRVHRRVKGIAPDGRPYSAADPELVTFIHVAEVASFLASSQRYGTRPVTPAECDRYYEEVAPVATIRLS